MTPTKTTLSLPQLSKRLHEGARRGDALRPLLVRHAPQLVHQLEALGEDSRALAPWGSSRNLDEHAGRELVHPAVLAVLWELAGREPPSERVHAGLMHAYAYLFSTVRTPWGFKRSRWVRPTIERGLSLPRGLLSPRPPEGTLLGNLGALLLRVLEREGETRVPRLEPGETIAAAALETPLPATSHRIRELVQERNGSPCRPLSLRTDLLPFHDGTGALLIYAVGAPGREKLITTFPVEGEGLDELKRLRSARSLALRLRYNATVAGFRHDAVLRGSRRVLRTA